jgi:hypothetical protein
MNSTALSGFGPLKQTDAGELVVEKSASLAS